MSIRYSHFRVLLFTLALGLASVWMWRGFAIANEFVAVDLPVVESSEVLQIFPAERRRMPMDGGSGPDGPNISLHLESESSRTLTFHLINALNGKAIYIPLGTNAKSLSYCTAVGGCVYIPQKVNAKSWPSNAVPYFLECLTPDSSDSTVFLEDFQFTGKVRRLNPSDHLTIRIPKPKITGRCWVSVPVFYDPDSAIEQFWSVPFPPMHREEFIWRSKFYVSHTFFNEKPH